jgi:hypothetical protein
MSDRDRLERLIGIAGMLRPAIANQAPHRHRQAQSGTYRGREPPHARHTCLGQPTADQGCERGNHLDAPAYPLYQEHGQNYLLGTKVPASCAARRAKPGEELPGMIASRSCTGVACADCALRRPPKSIAMPRSTLWRSTHPRRRLLPEAGVAGMWRFTAAIST